MASIKQARQVLYDQWMENYLSCNFGLAWNLSSPIAPYICSALRAASSIITDGISELSAALSAIDLL